MTPILRRLASPRGGAAASHFLAAVGVFVVSLDSMVNVAFPAMAASFAVPPEAMRWVIICYVGCYAVMSFVGGSAGDRIGHVRVFAAGLIVSAIAYALGAWAPTLAWLLGARVVQGLGGGLVYGTAPSLGTLGVAAAARGRALGFVNAAIGVGFAAGPVLAGLLVEAWGWRVIFWTRVPLALLALACAPAARAEAAIAPRLVAARDILRAAVLWPGALGFVANAAIFAVWLLAPFHLVITRGLSVGTAGLLFTLTPLGTALAAPPAGRLADRVGVRVPMALGLVIEATGLAMLGGASAETPVVLAGAALFAAGFGLGFFQVPNMAAVMAEFPPSQQGTGGGVSFLARTLGVVAGVAVLAQLVAARRSAAGFDRACAEAFVVAAVAVAVAAVAATSWRPRHRAGYTRER